jgi:opacity protein-like surface antigen
MKKILALLALGTATSFSVFAQDVPKVDLYLGYLMFRANSAQTIPAFTANGGIGTLGLNANNHIGLEIELGGYHNGNVNNHQFDTTAFSYLVGPRISMGRTRRVDPYMHALFGGQHVATSIAVAPTTGTGVSGTSSRISDSQAAFAMAIGGGLDIKLSDRVFFRPIQLDYFLSRAELREIGSGSSVQSARNQNNLRYSVGFGFNF